MTNKIKTLVSLLLATGLMAFGAAANADSFTVDLSTEFSGADAPEGSTPWLEMTIDDGDTAGSVTITIVASNLTDDEFIHEFYFNFNPAQSSGDLGGQGSFSFIPADSITVTNGCALGDDAFSAGGGGLFDIYCAFQTSSGSGRWTNGETFIIELSGPTYLTASDFDFLSTPNGGNGTWTAAAHIQSIGSDNEGSGWIGGRTDGGDVPEPGTLALFGLGLTLIGVATRRRRITPES